MAKLTGKSKEMADEIQAVLLKYGHKTTRYFVSVDAATSRLTINMTNPTENGKVASVEDTYALEYTKHAFMFGCAPQWLGMSFRFANRDCTLVGMKPGRSSKNIIITVSGMTGNRVISAEQLSEAFRKVA